MRFLAFAVLCLFAFASANADAADDITAFEILAAAYSERDADKAASAYAPDAEVVYAYEGTPQSRHIGRDAIRESFASFFTSLDTTLKLDLNFRVSHRADRKVYGFYRLRYGEVEKVYGRFEVRLTEDGLFQYDRSSNAVIDDFEDIAGSLLINPDANDLDRDYYSRLTGRYALPDECALVVTQSVMRLFVRNTCDNAWRGLERVSGRHWSAGNTVLPDDNIVATYEFAPTADGKSASVVVQASSARSTASRVDLYTVEDVSFQSFDGIDLAGTLYLPRGVNAPVPAMVLVHGSGPQNRDGYASIIAVMADAFAAEGRAVLAFDKRGSGASGGYGDRAGFDVLAKDVRSASEFLASRQEISADHIGLAGSSQAGWVIAKAIELGAEPADVFLLGAAGAAFTVREQNLFNTDVRMRCEGISKKARRFALKQQEAFFDALADREKSPVLDEITARAAQNAEISNWLFPDSSGLEAEDAWFTVLDPRFEPLPVWRDFKGKAVFVFSEFDDSTNSQDAMRRLRNTEPELVLLKGAQHLGLKALSRCDGALGDRTGFQPKLFGAIGEFVRSDR